MNKTIIIAAISAAFIAGTLTAGTWVEAETPTNEPLNNVNSFVLNADYSQDQETDVDSFGIYFTSNAPYKVDFCATNESNEKIKFEVSLGTTGGVENSIGQYVPKKSTSCWNFGGAAGQSFVWTNPVQAIPGNPVVIAGINYLITTQTTSFGTVTIEVCEIGEKEPFNCQPL